jgi:zinc/manganese transport system substrate-binding protein
LSNPDQDPHLFEASPSVALEVATARIVVVNGADYDPWAEKLLAAAKPGNRRTIVVADLLGKAAGDNPHLWYDPATMPAFARALSAELASADPANKADYDQRLAQFLGSLKRLQEKIAALRAKFAGAPVTATEPVFGYMAAALGLAMRNERFQRAVMNGTEPGASDIAAFETDLRQRRVKLLLFNSQATDPAAQRLLGIAKASGVPVVGVTETEPKGKTFQAWMLEQLDAVGLALANAPS